MINFGVKIFFPENWVFEKKRYRLKEKTGLNFLKSSPWKSNENYDRKNLFKENGKKIAMRRIFGGFLKKML